MKKLMSLLFAGVAIVALSGCTDKIDGVEEPTYGFYVDAIAGDDQNDGSESEPFKTITKALSVVDIDGSVKVNPGMYDDSNGETFPLEVPEGVSLIGDAENRGVDTVNTEINGGGKHPLYDESFISTTMLMRTQSKISGFVIKNTDVIATFPQTLTLRGDDKVTMHRNTLIGNSSTAIYIVSSDYHTITENTISNNHLGISFRLGGLDSRVENNIITYNGAGVEYDSTGGDLGGGSIGSLGGNIISCNIESDLWTNSTVIINAKNNLWDHVPPSESNIRYDGSDIFNGSGATINVDGASLAPNPCL